MYTTNIFDLDMDDDLYSPTTVPTSQQASVLTYNKDTNTFTYVYDPSDSILFHTLQLNNELTLVKDQKYVSPFTNPTFHITTVSPSSQIFNLADEESYIRHEFGSTIIGSPALTKEEEKKPDPIEVLRFKYRTFLLQWKEDVMFDE
jgi:hypothetical protein